MSALRSTNVKNTHVAVPFATRSGSVEMSQKNFMNRNATMSNMEQMKNMYKHSIHASQVNVNKPAQASKAESIAVDTEPVFQISGQQEEIKRVGGENYVDRSVDITPENIMASIQEFYEEFKHNEGRQKIMAEINRKALMGWIALETASFAKPAFAEGNPPQGTVSYTTFL